MRFNNGKKRLRIRPAVIKHRAANHYPGGFRGKSRKCMEFWRIPLQLQALIFRPMLTAAAGLSRCGGLLQVLSKLFQ